MGENLRDNVRFNGRLDFAKSVAKLQSKVNGILNNVEDKNVIFKMFLMAVSHRISLMDNSQEYLQIFLDELPIIFKECLQIKEEFAKSRKIGESCKN